MIKFNGYPFLEKEDKDGNDEAFIEPSESRFSSSSRALLTSHSSRSLTHHEERPRHDEGVRHAALRDRFVLSFPSRFDSARLADLSSFRQRTFSLPPPSKASPSSETSATPPSWATSGEPSFGSRSVRSCPPFLVLPPPICLPLTYSSPPPPFPYAEKARRQRHLTPQATCTFNMLDGVQLHPSEPHPSDGDAWGFDAGEHDADEMFEAAEQGNTSDFADFGPFVDQVSRTRTERRAATRGRTSDVERVDPCLSSLCCAARLL